MGELRYSRNGVELRWPERLCAGEMNGAIRVISLT